jgi:hypothetical protein
MTEAMKAVPVATRAKVGKPGNGSLFHARLWDEGSGFRTVRDWAISDANKAFQEFADEVGKPKSAPAPRPKRK